jgi:hypothetical protein
MRQLVIAKMLHRRALKNDTFVLTLIYPINVGLGITIGSLAGCWKTLSESFDGAQDERSGSEIIEDFPFMLRFSKHSEPFFRNLLESTFPQWARRKRSERRQPT